MIQKMSDALKRYLPIYRFFSLQPKICSMSETGDIWCCAQNTFSCFSCLKKKKTMTCFTKICVSFTLCWGSFCFLLVGLPYHASKILLKVQLLFSSSIPFKELASFYSQFLIVFDVFILSTMEKAEEEKRPVKRI